jgi:hypothetical protein
MLLEMALVLARDHCGEEAGRRGDGPMVRRRGVVTKPNTRVQATAYSLRFAALHSGFQPRLTRSVRLRFS